ncbi:hypothetical protein BCR42DRAFT_420587 [Absidia repens]|uniref:Uncharacterized protein n=1 Tax=Absidia repens TaxID=90262 RepID=A0A1X2I9Y0_9FUNG|nr:hypothetical protein BCR42DRAFT_420587 [Absidia repens]
MPSTTLYIQENIQSMILDYFEVGCHIDALELIETALISYRKPSTAILQVMVGLLLRKREPNEQKHYKEHWIATDKTHDLLLKILRIFGPRIFDSLWDTFDHSHLAEFKRQQQQLQYQNTSDPSYTDDDDDDGAIDTSDHAESFIHQGLEAFEDFWDFVSQCLKYSDEIALIQAKSYLHLLDILVSVLEQDFYFKRDCAANVTKSTLLTIIQKNVVGGWDRFERYLDIMLEPFGSHQNDCSSMIITKQKALGGRLLNLMHAISCYDIPLSMTSLADQTFRSSMQRGVDCFTNLIKYIKFDSFILQLCDCGFLDVDWSTVPQRYHYLKKEKPSSVENPSRWLNKWMHTYTKTRPKKIKWKNLYLHVFLIWQYYHSILKISSLRYDLDHNQGTVVIRGCNDLDNDALSTLLDDGMLKTWYRQVTTWMEQCRKSDVVVSSRHYDDEQHWEQRIELLLDTLTF